MINMKKTVSAILAIAMILTLGVTAQARLVGDVTKDGTVNSADALEVLKYSVGLAKEIDEVMADVDVNGEINSSDALCILQISVGLYKGELEIPDEPETPDEPEKLITSYKKDNVDPILQSKKFTISTTVIDGDDKIPSTITIDGDNLCADMMFSITNVRMLILDGVCYLILPDIITFPKKITVYAETSKIPSFSITNTAKETYVKSEYLELDGKTYVVEEYSYSDGSTVKYYFLDGVWKASETTDSDGVVSTKRIDSLSPTVDSSKFSLNGFVKVANLDDYI